jgi:AcrR family transcriptional regulator
METSLRERKKQRTRQALAATALEMFTERGFDATTLDELVEAVEVSKRTFFRNFTSKEDVAVTVVKYFWRSYVSLVEDRELHGSVLTVLRDALLDNIRDMDESWFGRFRPTCRLTDSVPALRAHVLEFCAEVKAEIACGLAQRLGVASDLRLRLLVETVVSVWHCATEDWMAQPGADPRALLDLVVRTFDEVPDSLALTMP